MTVYRYSARALAPDYVRCAAGLLLTLGPLAALTVLPWVAWALGLAAAAFAAHGVRTALRHLGAIEVDGGSIAVRGPLARRIAWRELTGLRLRYFSTRRDRARGWMLLTLRGRQGRGRRAGWGRGPRGCGTIRIESTLPGFEDIVLRAAEAAGDAQLGLEAATLGNLETLGIESSQLRQSADPDAGFVERQRP